MPRRERSSGSGFVLISVVAESFGVHPQTLRLYERHGLLKPSRSAGNTRLYDQAAIRRLEQILALTRDLGINLAGVEVVLQMRERIEELEGEVERLLEVVRQAEFDERHGVDRQKALVPTGTRALARR